MPAYLPAAIWALSSLACLVIAKRRGVPSTPARALAVTFLGPFAIPFVVAARPQPARRR